MTGDPHVRVLTHGYLDDPLLGRLRADLPGVAIDHVPAADPIGPGIEEAEVVAAAGLSSEVLARAHRLRWFHTWAAGPDRDLAAGLAERDVVVTSSKGNGAVPLAEHALMLMLMLRRRAWRWMTAQAERRWDRYTHGELAGRTCGIVGLGHVGADLALKAKALHMRVVGVRRTPRPTPHVDEVLSPERLPDLLAASDAVVVTVPLTARTRALFGEAEFRAMRPGALFVCVSRGATYDPGALDRALRDGHLGGAGLDAHPVEPLPRDSPLWSAPNTVVTPHNGATSPEAVARAAGIFADNLRRYVAGRPLHNLVDKSAGY